MNKSLKLILVIIFITAQALGADKMITEYWKMGDNFVELIRTNQYLISESCYHLKSKKLKCDAFNILKKSSVKGISSAMLDGGKNPASVLCSKIVGGEVIYLRDLSGNDNTFCMFKDKSFVSNSTLYQHGISNDKK